MKTLKAKICKICKTEYQPRNSLQIVCSGLCAVKYISEQKHKKEQAKRKEQIKTKSDHLKEAQKVFNAYIRARDKDQPCISCQRHHKGQYHAGHYRTTKAAPQLRFDEQNVHKQCSTCNNHLSGNITEYRINLIKKIGIDAVERLETDNTEQRLTIDQIKEIKIFYKKRLQ